MSAVLTRTDHLDRTGWLDARRQGIGGSDAAAILGLDPFKSPLAVYLDKRGDLPDDEPGEAAYWGNLLEDPVAHAAAQRINDDLEARGGAPVTVKRRHAILRHPDLPWMLANVDREVYGHPSGPGILEVKTTGHWAAQTWTSPDDMPERYHVQLQHYLAVTGRSHGWIAVLIAGQQLLVEHVQRDDELIDALIDVEQLFWTRVQEGNPPPAQARDDDLTRRLFRQAEIGTTVVLPAEARDLIRERAAAKAAEDAAADRRKQAEARLRQLIGDAEQAYLPGDDRPIFTYRQVTSTRFDTRTFEQDHPDLAARYRTTATHRRFNFTKGE
jgi:putative phage-type endonuclease